MCKSILLHSLSVLLIVLVPGLLFAQKSPEISQSESVIDGGNQNASSNQTESGTTEEPDETTDANVEDEQSSEEVKQNRLASESSPYLLQHARNPVDWYPWGQEAFDKAKRENKLVFLSVGYAACHWCHVMERESFEDDEIAKVLNERFVCVKVDREERPDVDQIYMTAVQLVSGHGGWPMSVFVLPDGKPFWGGTYFPARDGDRGNSTGFLTILSQIDLAWKEQTEQVRAQSIAVTKAIQSQQLSSAGDFAGQSYDDAMVAQTLMALRKQYDATYGGFSAGDGGPKFPEPSNLHFLASVAASEQTKNIKPSPRGELEITSVNQIYLKLKKLNIERLSRGFTWLDTGTHESLMQASRFVETIEKRQGLKVACLEEIAFRLKYIDANQLRNLAYPLKKNGYGQYLLNLIN